MNKIATYLNEHLIGDATSAKAIRKKYSIDGSILTITPELVVFPVLTNDVRKVARFTWQLAERGHAIGVTVQGTGSDVTGAAIGKGVLIRTSLYLNQILNFLPKERLIHVQPGARISAIQEVLKWHGLALQNVPLESNLATVGGLLANNTLTHGGTLAGSIEKMEVILANGDVIETRRINKHEVNKKLGLQTFEGEIYRKISGIIEDNEAAITGIAEDATPDNTGYRGIASVRRKDGSMDLTPLFLGSQGTLGIISEVVLKASFYAKEVSAALILAESRESARDIADSLLAIQPSQLNIIEGTLVNRARGHGRQFSLLSDDDVSGSLILVKFDDLNDRARNNKLKRLQKAVEKMGIGMVDTSDHTIEEFEQIDRLVAATQRMESDDKTVLPILSGAYIPNDRREEFFASLDELAAKQHVELPVRIDALSNTLEALPYLKLSSVSDKQKVFRLINEFAAIVAKHSGSFVAGDAEGRLKANAAWALLDDTEVALYEAIREVFDPFGTMNPGVKQKADVRTLVSSLRASYDVADLL
jgi:FAD/FMN-containing dehydrogenase